MAIGEVIRRARRERALSQRRLAQMAGVPQSTVARIETAALSPRMATVERILEVLGYEIGAVPLDDGVDRSLIRRMLALTPEERVRYAVAGGDLVSALRAGVKGENDENTPAGSEG